MTDAVDETLRLWRRTVFQWGTTDCCLSAADYVLLMTGSDPAPEFRDVYDTEVEAVRLIENAGGVVALLDSRELLLRARWPDRGDLVVIWTGAEQVVGLCTGQGAAFRLPRGVKETDLRFLTVIACWKVM